MERSGKDVGQSGTKLKLNQKGGKEGKVGMMRFALLGSKKPTPVSSTWILFPVDTAAIEHLSLLLMNHAPKFIIERDLPFSGVLKIGVFYGKK